MGDLQCAPPPDHDFKRGPEPPGGSRMWPGLPDQNPPRRRTSRIAFPRSTGSPGRILMDLHRPAGHSAQVRGAQKRILEQAELFRDAPEAAAVDRARTERSSARR